MRSGRSSQFFSSVTTDEQVCISRVDSLANGVTCFSEFLERLLCIANYIDNNLDSITGPISLENFSIQSHKLGRPPKITFHPRNFVDSISETSSQNSNESSIGSDGAKKTALPVKDFYKLAIAYIERVSGTIHDRYLVPFLKQYFIDKVMTYARTECVVLETERLNLYIKVYETMREIYARHQHRPDDSSDIDKHIQERGALSDVDYTNEYKEKSGLQAMLKNIPLENGESIGLSDDLLMYVNNVVETKVLTSAQKERFLIQYLNDVVENWTNSQKKDFQEDDAQKFEQLKQDPVISVLRRDAGFYKECAYKGILTVEQSRRKINRLCDRAIKDLGTKSNEVERVKALQEGYSLSFGSEDQYDSPGRWAVFRNVFSRS